MNIEDKDIFKLMDSFSDEEKIQLLQCITFSETNIEIEQKNRIKNSVINKLKTTPAKKRNKIKVGIIAASIILCVILSALSPFGQRTLAELSEKLYFIPGLGKASENKGHDIFILSQPVNYSYSGNNITVNSVTKDDTALIINISGDGSFELMQLTIEDEKGNKYISSDSSLANGYGWLGIYDFINIPEEVNSFRVLLPDDASIPVTLKKAESYTDYESMGPTDVKNNFGITLVPTKLDDKIKFDLIQHQSQDKQVYSYGKSDIEGHNDVNILINDDKGKSYAVGHTNSTVPLSEFSFTPNSNSVKYTVQIPEITLTYKVNNEVTLPMPKEGENQINRNIDLHGFSLKITGIFREGNKVKVYVDTNYNENKRENLSNIFVDMTAMSLDYYKWNLNDHITTESIEFNIKPQDKKLKIKFKEINTIMNGPWIFELNSD